MTRSLFSVLAAAVMLASLWLLGGCNGARDTAIDMLGKNDNRGFMIQTIDNAGRERKYGMFVPLNYTDSGKYPVIVFLHGVGEGGSDAHANLRVGLAPFVADNAATFPFICIFPQSPNGYWNEDSDAASDVIAIVHQVAKEYPGADMDRVSLTGLSTGGYGTWAIGALHKDVFAALVPMGTSESPSKFAQDLVDVPVQAYCNGGDMFAGFTANDRGMVDRITGLGGTHAQFTQTDGPGHDCWEGVYGDGAVFSWLENQRLSARRPAAPIGSARVMATPSNSTPGMTPATPSQTPVSNGGGSVPATPY